MTTEIWIVSLLFLGISLLVSSILKSKFTGYNKIPLANGLSGKEIAEEMFRENGIYDVKVTSVEGFLSGHYNPKDKIINLSAEVYNGNSISAAATTYLVAALAAVVTLIQYVMIYLNSRDRG
ncbi:MAG: zinc metallopeptidase [Chitinophagaceae bacterium]